MAAGANLKMLSETSRQGITDILASLDDTTVMSLSVTITCGLLKNRINSREEATKAILNHSSDARSFLNRKAVTREVLLTYLHNKNISINLPASKNEIVQEIAQYWETHSIEPRLSTNSVEVGDIAQLAQQFTHWFYSQFNKSEMNGEHFFSDAKLVINVCSQGQITTESVEGDCAQIVHALLGVKRNFNLSFNPNLNKGGVQGKLDPHGLVLVAVCGTLHQDSACVGIFEQVFGLVRDPRSLNNWKIKTTELNLKSQSVTTLPTLEN